MLSGLVYALLAGLLGAVASSSAKLSLGASYLQELCVISVRKWTDQEGSLNPLVDTAACNWLHIPLRLICGLLLFLSNAVMWTFFAKALRHSSSSARATVTTTASNFISSPPFMLFFNGQDSPRTTTEQAFLGHVIFGESHALLWWVGITFTLLGLFILHGSSTQEQKVDVKKDD